MARENQFNMFKGSSIRLTADFTSETTETESQRDDIVKLLKKTKQKPLTICC